MSAIVAVIAGWVRRKIRPRPERPPTIRVLLKPYGEVLHEVEVEVDPESDG